MKKKKIYKLKNGPQIVLYKDTSKHCTIASLFVMFGGKNKKIKIGNKNYKIPDGMAHFLEHLLIEHSIYRNILLEFENKSTKSNGYTTKDTTEYVINSVIDFEEDLVKLIHIVNLPSFNKKDVEETKKAIKKEKMMSKDENFEALEKLDYQTLFSTIEYPNILGEINDIDHIDYSNIKFSYDTFYQKENQILIVAGNFNIGKIEKIIKNTYDSIKKEKKLYQLPRLEEPQKIVYQEKNITRNVHMDYVRINYKIDIKNISDKDRLKLDFYLFYFLSYLFDSSSKTYNRLVKNKTCVYGINYSYQKTEDFFIIKIGTTTNNHNEFIQNVKRVIEKKETNQEDFELRKRQTIIAIILREDSFSATITPFIQNIISYNYYDMDKIEDIENFTFDDYKNWIEFLDFNNYSITKMLREKEDEINE